MKQLVSSVKVNKKIETGQPSKEHRKKEKKNEKIMTAWNGNEENKKIKMGQHAKGDRKSRSARDMSIRSGSGRVDSIRVGSDQVIFLE